MALRHFLSPWIPLLMIIPARMKFHNYHATLDALPKTEEKPTTGWTAKIIKLLTKTLRDTYLNDMEKLCTTGSPEPCKQFVNSLKDDCERLRARVSHSICANFLPI